MGVEVPQEAPHPTAGVLSARHHPAPRSGIMMQPDVLENVREIWEKPHSCPAVDKRVDNWHRLLPSESLCLASHPPAQSLVVAAAVKTPAASASAPPGKEEKLLDTFGKKVYSNASLHLRQANADAILAGANNRLWESIEKFSDLIPEKDRNDFKDGIYDARRVAELQVSSAIFQVDTAARAMCIGVDMRRQAWLKSTSLQQDAHDKVLDLPFDGLELFSPGTDALLEKCTTGAKTAKSLTPISKPAPRKSGSPVPGGSKTSRRSSDGPGFRGFIKRQKGRDDKGSSSFRKQGKGSSSHTPRSSSSGKKD